jgi:hypothetical protein
MTGNIRVDIERINRKDIFNNAEILMEKKEASLELHLSLTLLVVLVGVRPGNTSTLTTR